MPKYTGPEFASCVRCPSPAGQLVRFFSDDHDEALCYKCWQPMADQGRVRVLYWINKYGRLTFEPGSTTGPFNINHP